MNLASLWQALEAQVMPSASGLLQRSAHAGTGSAVSAGLLLPGRIRVLLIRLPVQQAQMLIGAGLTPAMTLSLIENSSLFPGQVTVQVQAVESRHQELFVHIGDDLVHQLQTDPQDPARVLIDRLGLWREFLHQRGDGEITETWLRGLFGELWFLLHHVLPRLLVGHAHAAIAAWTGPLGAAHDFTPGPAALDMKTGTAIAHTVEISSLEQLTVSQGTRLFLGHLRLRWDSQGETVSEVIERIRVLLMNEPDARSLLEDRLLASGYRDGDRASLEYLRLAVQGFDVYEITADFPSLTRANVPAAIRACGYTLDLRACRAFLVTPGDIPGSVPTPGASNGQ